MNITIENWKSEYKRLESCFKHVTDAQSIEAQAINDHLQAVSQIINELMEPSGEVAIGK